MLRRLLPFFVALVALSAGLTAALAFDRVYKIQIRNRPPDPLVVGFRHEATARHEASRQPLSLRLVDSGGVGIPLDHWGMGYSHDRRAFHRCQLVVRSYPRRGSRWPRVSLQYSASVHF